MESKPDSEDLDGEMMWDAVQSGMNLLAAAKEHCETSDIVVVVAAIAFALSGMTKIVEAVGRKEELDALVAKITERAQFTAVMMKGPNGKRDIN